MACPGATASNSAGCRPRPPGFRAHTLKHQVLLPQVRSGAVGLQSLKVPASPAGPLARLANGYWETSGREVHTAYAVQSSGVCRGSELGTQPGVPGRLLGGSDGYR